MGVKTRGRAKDEMRPEILKFKIDQYKRSVEFQARSKNVSIDIIHKGGCNVSIRKEMWSHVFGEWDGPSFTVFSGLWLRIFWKRREKFGIIESCQNGQQSKWSVSTGMGSPADGYSIHIQAPHLMPDGTPGGPYHHYCKGISPQILQCLLFETTAANAPLVAIEYFVSKELTRKLPLIQWHRYFHDHKVEIATGRVLILDIDDPAKVKALAEAASKTDGVIYHLWKKGLEFPDGSVSFPQSLGHVFNRPESSTS